MWKDTYPISRHPLNEKYVFSDREQFPPALEDHSDRTRTDWHILIIPGWEGLLLNVKNKKPRLSKNPGGGGGGSSLTYRNLKAYHMAVTLDQIR